ncbi:MAG: peptidoglycan-binding protein LysM [Ignavibacteriales bacterium CG_4_9_14_3_um_filter_34_10]|nr:MAG: peptidoglycan-binding protein LysM [Ignavibacteriales bacterium CG_4_9_14_3_um_filter_34_10]
MKISKFLVLLIAFSVLGLVSVSAQDKEMTEEEWQMEINTLNTKKAQLTKDISSLQKDVNNLKTKKTNMASYEDCMKELYAMSKEETSSPAQISESDVADYRKQVSDLNSMINNRSGSKQDLLAQLEALKQNNNSALPEFFDKVHSQLQRAMDSWVEAPQEVMYTVVKGDHLWGIARKKDHYGNGFAWPVIYNANRDSIKNPDLIYPKQEFKIPNLTEEEKAKYEKARKNYKPAPPTQTAQPTK